MFNLNVLEKIQKDALSGDRASYDKLRPIQSIALHFMNKEK
jgi:hypothetical protein